MSNQTSTKKQNRTARPVPGPVSADSQAHYVTETSPRRVRVMVQGKFIADSTAVELLFETGRLPVYYFPEQDVAAGVLSESGRVKEDPVKERTTFYDITVGERMVSDGAWSCEGIDSNGPDISSLVAFDWNKMDSWFEEDQEVFVHARDPYHRVDVVESSRRIEVSVNGVEVADSRRPMMLFETGLPTRYYLPKTDVRLDLLERTELHTACPYKGTADYWSVRTEQGVTKNVCWGYETPIPETPKIAGLICFYDEKVDVTIDGVRQERPRTKWS